MPLTTDQTYIIHIEGIVQGVGFRPFVYQLAKAMQLKGTVCNDTSGVKINLTSDPIQIEIFYTYIIKNPPAKARITQTNLTKKNYHPYTDFSIVLATEHATNATTFQSPDIALCANCRKELRDIKNKRYHYPFITCTHCGPRYAIATDLPYDRINTSFKIVKPCVRCEQEYNNPSNRRFFAQTISCPDCGIALSYYENGGLKIQANNAEILQQISTDLAAGKIVALKNTNGFLLLTDATNPQAITTLRRRKKRPSKPFAILFSSEKIAQEYVEITPAISTALHSDAAPIVVSTIKNKKKLALETIAPKLNKLGVYLPSTGLLALISQAYPHPLIATSANIAGSPIIAENSIALEILPMLADSIVTHPLSLNFPQDDSVVQYTKTSFPVLLRRSKGLAPAYLNYTTHTTKTIVAVGAMLKSSFCIAQQNHLYLSPYLGNTNHWEGQTAYEKIYTNFLQLLKTQPEILLCDIHPQYFSTLFAIQLAQQFNIPLYAVQHHIAHFSAILGEHHLLDTPEKILGIIWDGTGFGEDKNIWGNEFFVYQKHQIKKIYQAPYFKNILGDKFAQEPRLAALSLLSNHPVGLSIIQTSFTPEEWNYYGKLIQVEDKPILNNSMGRIFDAVAAILQICTIQTYEGEAALLLEQKATQFYDKNPNYAGGYAISTKDFLSENWLFKLFHYIVEDKINQEDTEKIAFKFHLTLIALITTIAEKNTIHQIAFSGGVFQNALLIHLIQEKLSPAYTLFFHKALSSNDENIAFGQMIFYDNQLQFDCTPF